MRDIWPEEIDDQTLGDMLEASDLRAWPEIAPGAMAIYPQFLKPTSPGY